MRAWSEAILEISEYYVAAVRCGVLGAYVWFGAYILLSFYVLMPLTGTVGAPRHLGRAAESAAGAIQSLAPMLMSGFVTALVLLSSRSAARSAAWVNISLVGVGTAAVKFVLLEGTSLFFYRRFSETGGTWIVAGTTSAEIVVWMAGAALAWLVSVRKTSESAVSGHPGGRARIWAVWLGCASLLVLTAFVLAVVVPAASVAATVAVVVVPVILLWVRAVRGVLGKFRGHTT